MEHKTDRERLFWAMISAAAGNLNDFDYMVGKTQNGCTQDGTVTTELWEIARGIRDKYVLLERTSQEIQALLNKFAEEYENSGNE